MTIEQVKSEVGRLMNMFDSPVVVERMALQGFTDSKERIFTKGLRSDGANIGGYADSTIEKKKREGRFSTNKIIFRDTETLVDSYLAEARSKDKWVVGFADVSRDGSVDNAELVDIIENKYGDVFPFSDNELKNMERVRDDFYNQNFK